MHLPPNALALFVRRRVFQYTTARGLFVKSDHKALYIEVVIVL